MSLEIRTLPEGLTASREYWRSPVRGLMFPYAPPVKVLMLIEASPPSRIPNPKLCLWAVVSEGVLRTCIWMLEPWMSLTIWPSFKFLKSTLTARQVLMPAWPHCGIREVSLVASSVNRNSSSSFAKIGPQKAVVQKVSPFGPHPQELQASFQESPSDLNNFKIYHRQPAS